MMSAKLPFKSAPEIPGLAPASASQQALDYARILDIPCVFSSNGDGFLFHDRSIAPFAIPEGNPQRHEGSDAFVIAEGNPQHHEGSHDGTAHMTSQVAYGNDKKKVDAQTCQVIVLDANIASMTKFKQIIGRGTRINEEYGKMYFTILDFRNVTDLFADPAFDGDPIVPARTYHEDEDLSTIIDEEQEALADIPVIDEENGTALEILPPKTKDFFGEPPTTTGYAQKVYVNGVDVTVLVSRELHFDNDGKPITTSLKDHARQLLTGQYASLDVFLSRWNSAERKQALLEELAEQGIPVEILRSAVDTEVDLFDLICHVAYDQPPLTRRERALNVKKRDYFTKYGEQARRVLEALLDKYADEGIENLESLDVLKVRPLTQFGSPIEILREFGGKERFLAAVRELEGEIYRVA